MTDLDDKVSEIVGPCPGCGDDPTGFFTLSEKKKIVKEDEDLEGYPGLRRTIRKLGEKLWCTNCIREAEVKDRSAMTRKRIDTLKRHTYRDELIPPIAMDMKFSKSEPENEAQNQAVWDKFRDGKRMTKNLWLSGDPGVGKTWLARCILNSQLAIGRSCAELSALKLNDIGRGWGVDKKLRLYKRVKVLLIEDIDKVTWSKQGLSALWNLVDARATAQKQIIITSNFSPRDVAAQMRPVVPENKPLVKSMFERFLPISKEDMVGESMRRNDGPDETGRVQDERQPERDEGKTEGVGTVVRPGNDSTGELF